MRFVLSFLILFSTSTLARIDNFFDGHTSIEKPFELRDPFQPPKFKSQSDKKTKQRAAGILDNVKKLDEKFDLDKITIVGVLIGKERRVLVKTKSSKTAFILKEGESFGKDGPEIKAILPGGVILVERISNIYGEGEYIETVVPISK